MCSMCSSSHPSPSFLLYSLFSNLSLPILFSLTTLPSLVCSLSPLLLSSLPLHTRLSSVSFLSPPLSSSMSYLLCEGVDSLLQVGGL